VITPLRFGTVYLETPFTRQNLKDTPTSAFRVRGVDYLATGRDKAELDRVRTQLRQAPGLKQVTTNVDDMAQKLATTPEVQAFCKVVKALAQKARRTTTPRNARQTAPLIPFPPNE